MNRNTKLYLFFLFSAILILLLLLLVYSSITSKLNVLQRIHWESTQLESTHLESTQDTTDRTEEILAQLETGYCSLGPGDFYISGLTMPKNSTLSGVGNSTRLILLEEGKSYAITLDSYCIVRDLQILGDLDVPVITKDLGDRHGILFVGNASEDAFDQPELCQIENCLIQNFSGGGITCSDTGYTLKASINVTDCSILNCGAGINISYFSEYHQFANVGVQNCYYGCINNGGNNVFINCNFGGNTLGFIIDNSSEQSPNNSHGSAVGCTFNHSDGNEGVGICILNAQYGFVFSDCQIFYSQIVIEDSNGISFNNCNFGSEETIQINDGTLVLLNGCMFGSAPNLLISDNENVELVNCYTRDGEPVTK